MAGLVAAGCCDGANDRRGLAEAHLEQDLRSGIG
jgi:hypothetical protein